jgi:thiosulfate reductase cytochrome b subunit
MAEKIYLYPKWIRAWHGINAILILLLIFTGISMQYSGPSAGFIRFDKAVSLHNISGMLLTANYLFFLLGNLFTSNGKQYRIVRKDLYERLKIQFMYYTFGIFRNEKPPYPVMKESKFNPLQQFTYVITMYYMVPIVFITGWAMLFPEVILAKILEGNGLKINDFIHVIIGFLISFFLLVHIYFCTIGASFVSNFKSMFNGYHESH